MNACTEPQITKQASNGLNQSFHLFVPAELVFFTGHFPDFPILPGVVQIDWAINLADKTQLTGAFSGIMRLKFIHPITGDRTIRLDLAYASNGQQMEFKYYETAGLFSSGTLLFEG